MQISRPMAFNRVVCAAPARPLGLGVRVVAIASLVLLGAGCGSSSPPSSGTRSPQGGATPAYKYAACMRDHGISSFPDPQVSITTNQTAIRQVVSRSLVDSPQGQRAQKACGSILPAPSNVSPVQRAQQEHARAQDLLAFAGCLRSHGVRNFPDPTPQGRLTLQMVSAGGDVHAPAFILAAEACIGAAHGVIRPGDVARAVNGTT